MNLVKINSQMMDRIFRKNFKKKTDNTNNGKKNGKMNINKMVKEM